MSKPFIKNVYYIIYKNILFSLSNIPFKFHAPWMALATTNFGKKMLFNVLAVYDVPARL
jgi:hypothetical protein